MTRIIFIFLIGALFQCASVEDRQSDAGSSDIGGDIMIYDIWYDFGGSDSGGDTSGGTDLAQDVFQDTYVDTFVPLIDYSNAACNPVTQEPCVSTEKCAFTKIDPYTLGCAQNGVKSLGSACGTNGDDCLRGGFCIALGGIRKCVKPCSYEGDCTLPEQCNVYIPNNTTPVALFCAEPFVPQVCDIYAQDCTAGNGCYFINASGTFECRLAGTRAQGQECTAGAYCLPGMICTSFSSGGTFTCHDICNTEGEPHCPQTELQCTAVTGAPAGSNLGICH